MAQDKPGLGWGEKIGLALLLVALALIIWPRGGSISGELVLRGTPLPELMAEGWLNVEPPVADAHGSPDRRRAVNVSDRSIPSRENLAGKVVLVDFWATWCPPCRASIPKLAKIYEKYQPLGVEFVGLTPETPNELPAVEGYVKSVEGFTWPVGYGAGMTLDMLGIYGLPTLVVFGKDGRAVWSGATTWDVDLALDEALAR